MGTRDRGLRLKSLCGALQALLSMKYTGLLYTVVSQQKIVALVEFRGLVAMSQNKCKPQIQNSHFSLRLSVSILVKYGTDNDLMS